MLPSCRPPVQGNGRNLLLITLETTRADHLGAYGYRRDTTPRIDALAREGVLFESFLTVSPRTNPSLASMMTSRYPHEHGVRNLLLTLEPGNRTLAEVLRDADAPPADLTQRAGARVR
jgi:arylsulfatase A-like enzyme